MAVAEFYIDGRCVMELKQDRMSNPKGSVCAVWVLRGFLGRR